MIRRLLLAAVFMSACSRAEEQKPVTQAAASPADLAQRCSTFVHTGLKLQAKTRAGLLAEVGRPLKTVAHVVPNRHVPEQQDSLFRFEYEGMIVNMRKPGPGGEMFENVIITKRKRLNYPYFNPGVKIEQVIAAIGEPQQRDGNRLVYICGGGEVEEPVVFAISEGAVDSIAFNYYVD